MGHTTSPSVGIFWGITTGQSLELAIDATPLAEAESYGDFLTHPRGHYDVWEHWRSLGAAWLKKYGLPRTILFSEYESHPRGRIVYDVPTETYVIYADRKLQATSPLAMIRTRFGLNNSKTIVRSDGHYVS